MNSQKQELVAHLLQQLAPQLEQTTPAGQAPPKAVLKAVQELASQLLRAQAKQEKRAAKALNPSPRELKQRLTDELTTVLTSHFSEEELFPQESTLLAESAEELAEKLTRLRLKQTRKTAASDSAAPPAAPPDVATPTPTRTPRRAGRKTALAANQAA
ncbi:hypothetical protein K3G63_21545 [Hymenobacter sp. HSC-4F20]|uniref:hypothetical protein n=1 Tax=Hymenobacter sp. HSC-4F20 TaxID=2864135 RepID=UPI001C7365BD|nr:hypothetical protein [Hymenobacter sp. HSC-4F20]MBX0293043.1 hypothetical protein [Hymenobacter sp. HSC-4F20]